VKITRIGRDRTDGQPSTGAAFATSSDLELLVAEVSNELESATES
jgi:hypothetical protein